MSDLPGEDSLISKKCNAPSYSPNRPWPWVSYDDPAWPFDPWDVMDDADLGDAAVRLAIANLRWSVEGMTALRATALVEQAIGRITADVVAEARTRRYSWGRIGEAFSVGRTAAQKRFGRSPSSDRITRIEDQYQRLKDYLHSAEHGVHDDEELEADARETHERCVKRRRGNFLDPLDTLPKVLPRSRGTRKATPSLHRHARTQRQ
ncbi:hypothetical protein [Streptomyces sp. NPDC004134]|uniref:hypothetical protein n=1 Tax=Streptomyces sp. NPDC004134 TaxID=3364691 RepID=UPI0036A659F4